MVKSAVFLLLILLFCNTVYPQEINNEFDLEREAASPEFWDQIRIMPVQFLDKSKEPDGRIRLSATFVSQFVMERMEFILPASQNQEDQVMFFEQGKEWEEKIDRGRFLKKFKKDFWLTTYFQKDRENILVAAHQFKNFQLLKTSYATDPERFRRSVNDPDYWKDMRMKIFYFYRLEENKAYWLYLHPIEKTEPYKPSDGKIISLPNGLTVFARLTINPQKDLRVEGQGVLTLQANTVFHKQEMENSKPRKVLKLTIFEAKFRIRPLVLEKDYFLKNHQNLWVCFYDSKYQSLVRILEIDQKTIPENED